MARRVARRVDDDDARRDLVAVIGAVDDLFDHRQAANGACGEHLKGFRQRVLRGVRRPEIPFRRGDVERRLRKHRVVEIIQKTPEVIGMRVGDEDLVDVFGRVSRRLHILDKLTGAIEEIAAAADVDKDQLLPCVDERDIDVARSEVRVEEMRLQIGLNHLARLVFADHIGRQLI